MLRLSNLCWLMSTAQLLVAKRLSAGVGLALVGPVGLRLLAAKPFVTYRQNQGNLHPISGYQQAISIYQCPKSGYQIQKSQFGISK